MIKKIMKLLFRKRREKLFRYKMKIQDFFDPDLDLPGFDLLGKREGVPCLWELGITDIQLKNETLVITLIRPGLLIGKRGTTIGQLEKYLSKDGPLKIKIIESRLWSSIN